MKYVLRLFETPAEWCYLAINGMTFNSKLRNAKIFDTGAETENYFKTVKNRAVLEVEVTFAGYRFPP